MSIIYKHKKDMPQELEYVELNDVFFNQNTVSRLDDRAKKIVECVDGSKMISKYKIESKFNRVILDIDCLSTGCKTVLNVLYYPDKIFCMKECGDNALEMLYSLKQGRVYSEYAVIPFELEKITVMVSSETENRVIEEYEELKEWWENEK